MEIVIAWGKRIYAYLRGLKDFMQQFIGDLVYGPDGRPSLLAVITFGLFVLFVFVTLYLLFTRITWEYYSIFAGTTTTLSAGGKVADKFINNHFGG